MNRIFLPIVAEQGSTPKPIPFGWAIYGVSMEYQHNLMRAGYPIQNWYAPACCMAYQLFLPCLRGRDYIVPMEQVETLAAQYPGRTWCLWNEPDYQTQDRTRPAEALAQTQAWIAAIRPHGRIAGYGVGLQPGYGGWRMWLDEFLHLGGPLPDCWHMHIYANNAVEFAGLYEQWQTWNSNNGNLPTIISEAGGSLYEDGNTDGWLSIYHHLRQWIDSRVEGVYLFTNQTEIYTQSALLARHGGN